MATNLDPNSQPVSQAFLGLMPPATETIDCGRGRFGDEPTAAAACRNSLQDLTRASLLWFVFMVVVIAWVAVKKQLGRQAGGRAAFTRSPFIFCPPSVTSVSPMPRLWLGFIKYEFVNGRRRRSRTEAPRASTTNLIDRIRSCCCILWQDKAF